MMIITDENRNTSSLNERIWKDKKLRFKTVVAATGCDWFRFRCSM